MTPNKFGKLIASTGLVARRAQSNTSALYVYGIMQDARPLHDASCLLKHRVERMKLKLFSAPIRRLSTPIEN